MFIASLHESVGSTDNSNENWYHSEQSIVSVEILSTKSEDGS